MQRSFLLVLATALAVGLGCDSGTDPVAPKDGVTLRITANPLTISLDGTSIIEVELLDSSTGTPLRTGTEVRFTTTLGTIDALATTNNRGIAQATLRADGRTGTATVNVSSGGNTGKIDIKVESGDLTANFEAMITGLTVFFEDKSTGDPTRWSWDFGDGATSTEQEPTHTYERAGTYLVRLTVANPDGSDSIVKDVVLSSDVVASFEFLIDGLTVSFTDTSVGSPTSWSWEFGDGAMSRERQPVHTYAAAGTYRVTLTVSNDTGEASTNKTVTVPESADLPKASFETTIDGLTVRFTDTSTGSPNAWAWEFGDGGRSSARNPTHTYRIAGTYLVSLTITNAAGDNTTSKTVTVPESADLPKASFETTIDDLTVRFTDTSTGSPDSWAWEFGDGGTSSARNPAHTYTLAGTYLVTLTVSNAAGESTTSKTVTVPENADLPSASFASSVDGLTVRFNDTSTGSPTGWAWDFGDGGTSSQRNPIHTYAVAGTYLVTLTVSNAAGSSTTSKTVTVPDPAQRPAADFSFVVDGLNVDFTDLSTGEPDEWEWDFGDGDDADIQNPAHTYAAAGTYTVTLKVSNDAGESIVSKDVTVP